MVRTPGPPTHVIKEPPQPNLIDLRVAVTSLLHSLLTARVAMDQESARLAELYEQDPILRQFPAPSFGIGEATLRLPYAAVDVQPREMDFHKPTHPSEVPQIQVHLNADVLARLPEHAIAYVELKLSQQQLSILVDEQKPE